jgi:hypothetical protein
MLGCLRGRARGDEIVFGPTRGDDVRGGGEKGRAGVGDKTRDGAGETALGGAGTGGAASISLGLRQDNLRRSVGFATVKPTEEAAGPASASVRSGPSFGSASCRWSASWRTSLWVSVIAVGLSFPLTFTFKVELALVTAPESGSRSRSSNVSSETTLRHPFQFTRLRRRPVRQSPGAKGS